MAPRCHLQMSPFSISWMCCTMRLMATKNREAHKQNYFICFKKKSPYEHLLTHVVDPSWNDDIYVLLRLRGGIKKSPQKKSSGQTRQRQIREVFILTGRQNSSKAGLTNVVYCVRICSRSLPRLMSRRTTGTGSKCWLSVSTLADKPRGRRASSPLRDSLTSESVSTKSFM